MDIKNKIIILASAILIILLAVIKFMYDANQTTKNENIRLSENLINVKQSEIFYKTRSNQQAVKIKSLNYTVSEFKQIESELYSEIKKLKIQVRNLIAVASITTTSGIRFTQPLIPVANYKDTAKCFTYQDTWNNISGCIKSDSVSIQAEYTDSLLIAITEIPKHRFLFWRWGVKAVEFDITSSNPSTTIKHVRYFELKNKY